MPTIAELAAKDQRVNVRCKCSARSVDLWPSKLLERWGDVEVETLKHLFRCTLCNRTGFVTLAVTDPWNPQQGGPGITMGSVSAEYLKEAQSREYARRRGRKNRLPEKMQAAIKAGAANLGKPKDV